MAERVGDRKAIHGALNQIGCAELFSGAAAGEENLERAVRGAIEADEPPVAGVAYINLGCGLARIKEWGRVDLHTEAGIVYCRERGLEAWTNCLLVARTEVALARGRWDDAAHTAHEIMRQSPDWHVSPRWGALLAIGLLRARRGDPGVWPPLDEALELAEPGEELQLLVPVAVARAEALWLEGRSCQIAAETEAALELALERNSGAFIGEVSLWRARAGLDGPIHPGVLPAHREALAGNAAGAARLLEEKEAFYEAALVLGCSGEPEAMRAGLDRLVELASRPAAALVARALREMGERGVPRGPRPQTRTNPAGLTPRQLEVLELLAEGMRNSEIAERLVVSRKTVDHHVSAILGKLEVGNRNEAGAAARRLGLIGEP